MTRERGAALCLLASLAASCADDSPPTSAPSSMPPTSERVLVEAPAPRGIVETSARGDAHAEHLEGVVLECHRCTLEGGPLLRCVSRAPVLCPDDPDYVIDGHRAGVDLWLRFRGTADGYREAPRGAALHRGDELTVVAFNVLGEQAWGVGPACLGTLTLQLGASDDADAITSGAVLDPYGGLAATFTDVPVHLP